MFNVLPPRMVRDARKDIDAMLDMRQSSAESRMYLEGIKEDIKAFQRIEIILLGYAKFTALARQVIRPVFIGCNQTLPIYGDDYERVLYHNSNVFFAIYPGLFVPLIMLRKTPTEYYKPMPQSTVDVMLMDDVLLMMSDFASCTSAEELRATVTSSSFRLGEQEHLVHNAVKAP